VRLASAVSLLQQSRSPPSPIPPCSAASSRAEAIDGVILGGTELPLLLSSEQIAGVPALDTTALHVAAIVRRLRQ